MVPAICRAFVSFADEDHAACVQMLATVLGEAHRRRPQASFATKKTSVWRQVPARLGWVIQVNRRWVARWYSSRESLSKRDRNQFAVRSLSGGTFP
jgi:hypothetical protein